MVFSSAIFLFFFLPTVILVNFLLPQKYQNGFLLLASTLFYFFGEPWYSLLLLFSISLNYFFGIIIGALKNEKTKKWGLSIAISIHLLTLIYYKYFEFLLSSFHLKSYTLFELEEIILPIGISFYTFQGISYLVDVYRNPSEVQRNFFSLGLYISFFPQLIAGPIVRYNTIAQQLVSRETTAELFSSGAMKFIRGLAKKLIFANTFAVVADNIMVQENYGNTPTAMAWLGIICYSLQIYYDFSGYSDMAIGLGRIMGFKFEENFNHPYISSSIQEFWRRWHISLSSWFKEYVYIPLGGNRKGVFRTYINLLVIFFLTGIWHGASWNFIVWGLFHGAFIILERIDTISFERIPSFLKRLYALSIILLGWVFFKTETLPDAMEYIHRLVIWNKEGDLTALLYVNNRFLFIFTLGIVFCSPFIKNKIQLMTQNQFLVLAFHAILLFFAIVELSTTSYNPFIYFRF